MKKINRKGFTLIELMVVIAILVIIMGIALPNITSSIERSKNKQNELKLKIVKSAAELYFDKYSSDEKVALSKLVSEKFLDEDEITDLGCQGDASSLTCCVYQENLLFETDPAICSRR